MICILYNIVSDYIETKTWQKQKCACVGVDLCVQCSPNLSERANCALSRGSTILMAAEHDSRHNSSTRRGCSLKVKIATRQNILLGETQDTLREHNSFGANGIWDVRTAACVAVSWFFPFKRPITNTIYRFGVSTTGSIFGVRTVGLWHPGLFLNAKET